MTKKWNVTILLLFSIITWWPTRNLPYHWDSASFVINSARKMIQTNYHPFIAPDSEYAHSPLFVATLAKYWQIVGSNIFNSHLFMLPFIFLLIWSSYKLSKSIFVALGVGLTPFIMGEYGMIYLDLPMAAATTTAIWLLLEKKYAWGNLALTIAVLLKLTALIVWPVMLGYCLYINKKVNLRLIGWYVFPVVLAGIWLLYHYNITGWWLTVPQRVHVNPTNLIEFFTSLKTVTWVFFMDQGRWWVSLISVYLLWKHKLDNKLIIHLAIIITGILFFTLMGELNYRYTIFMIPSFYLVVYQILSKEKKWIKLGVLGIYFGLMLYYLHPPIQPTNKYQFKPAEDLSYFDMIKLGQEIAGYIETNYPMALVIGSDPESYQVTQPWQGYVSRPVAFQYCEDYQDIEGGIQIVVTHPYSPRQIACEQMVIDRKLPIIKKFNVNNKWALLYRLK